MCFFDNFFNMECFTEKYLPSAHKKFLRERMEESKQEAERLAQAIQNSSLFVPNEEEKNADVPTPSELPPHILQRTFRIRDSFDKQCIYIHSLDPRCSRACLMTFLKETVHGIQAVYFGDPFRCPPSELCRPVFVLFDSPESAAAAFPLLNARDVPFIDTAELGREGIREDEKAPVPKSFPLRISLWKASSRASVINSAANTPRRVAKDLEQTRTLLKAFENHWGLQVGLVELLQTYRAANQWMKDMDEVDVLVHILRRVFGYEYWRGEYLEEFGRCYHSYRAYILPGTQYSTNVTISVTKSSFYVQVKSHYYVFFSWLPE